MAGIKSTLQSIAVILSITVLSGFAIAQRPPFKAFDKAVKEGRGGFAGDKGKLSKIFDDERLRLGEAFESELWKYIDRDPEKQYWIALFITERTYLHGNEPLPELANRIREQTLTLLGGNKDKKSLGRKYSLLRSMAIAAKQLRLETKALEYRSRAENILENYKDLSPYISGLTDYKKCVYANLQIEILPCSEDSAPKETIISAGVLNGRTTSMPKPSYPDKARLKGLGGRVIVKVVSDLNGNIISAEVLSGSEELHQVSIEAALAAKLSPTTLSGQLTKVSGTLVYNFVP